MTPNFNWRHKAIVLLLSTFVTLATLAVSGEIVVRYRERHRATVPGVMPFIYYRHATLGHALVRNFNYYEWVHTNPQGFRGVRSVATEPLPGVFRILAVGGSTTFDSFVTADSLAWPARLEYWLKQLDPQQRVEVINAGVPGYTVTQDLIRLETELYAYKPDLIIFYQGHNDLIANLRPFPSDSSPAKQRPNQINPVSPWRSWLEQNSLFYAKSVERIKAMRWASAPKRRSAMLTYDSNGAKRFERVVAEYLAVAQALQLRVVIPEVVQVSGGAVVESDSIKRRMWRTAVPYADPDTILLGYRRYNEVLRQMGSKPGVTFVPMLDLGIAGVTQFAESDPIHFNDLGADRFAKGLAHRLIADQLLNGDGQPTLRQSSPADVDH